MSSSIVIFFSYPTSSKFVNTLGLSKKYVESDHFTSSPLPKLLNEFPDSFPEALKSILEIKNSIKKKIISYHTSATNLSNVGYLSYGGIYSEIKIYM